jgi:MFS family permease
MQMERPGKPERRATRLIFLLCGVARSAWAPLVPYARAGVHANDQQFGRLMLCFGAGSILFMPAMGALASRYGTTLALSLFLFGASMGAIDVVMNLQALLVGRGIPSHLLATLRKTGTIVLTADEPPQPAATGVGHVTRR